MSKQEIKDLYELVGRDEDEMMDIERRIAELRAKRDEIGRRRNANAFRLMAAQREQH